MLDKSDAAPSVDNDDAVIWYRVHNCDPYIGMYDLFYLDAVLLHKLILSDFILNDKYIIPIFSARPTYRLSNSSVFQNRAAMIILGDGIGDFLYYYHYSDGSFVAWNKMGGKFFCCWQKTAWSNP